MEILPRHKRASFLSLLLVLAFVYYFVRIPLTYTADNVLTSPDTTEQISLEDYITRQTNYSWSRILDNVHPSGTEKGCIVASPSRIAPNYWFQWTRDSALVMKLFVRKYIDHDESMLPHIFDYISTQDTLQHLHTRSGDYSTGGLGEPKFNVDNTAYDGVWGRPQNDGPALRASVLMSFATEYIRREGDTAYDYVKKNLYTGRLPAHSVIKADLEYVSHNWYLPGFDIWEEVHGSHFFTLLVSLRALREGAQFARYMQDPGAAEHYQRQANSIHKSLSKFIDPSSGSIFASTDVSHDSSYHRSGLDASVIIAINQVTSSVMMQPWNVTNDHFIITHNAVVNSMRDLYPINNTTLSSVEYDDDQLSFNSRPGSIGRYPEDIYDGIGKSEGNPWFLTTLAQAEYLYNLYYTLKSKPHLIKPHHFQLFQQGASYNNNFFRSNHLAHVTNFFNKHLSFLSGNSNYKDIIELNENNQQIPLSFIKPNPDSNKLLLDAIFKRADEFVKIVKKFAPDMDFSEQFDRTTGEKRGALSLTWSHTAFITAARSRQGFSTL